MAEITAEQAEKVAEIKESVDRALEFDKFLTPVGPTIAEQRKTIHNQLLNLFEVGAIAERPVWTGPNAVVVKLPPVARKLELDIDISFEFDE